jgi:elongation factor G
MIPDSNMGDIMGEVNKRRGRILGMNPGKDNMQIVEAEVPVAEMSDFSVYLRQVTQGRGSYTTAFARYEPVPEHIAAKIIESRKSEEK